MRSYFDHFVWGFEEIFHADLFEFAQAAQSFMRHIMAQLGTHQGVELIENACLFVLTLSVHHGIKIIGEVRPAIAFVAMGDSGMAANACTDGGDGIFRDVPDKHDVDFIANVFMAQRDGDALEAAFFLQAANAFQKGFFADARLHGVLGRFLERHERIG